MILVSLGIDMEMVGNMGYRGGNVLDGLSVEETNFQNQTALTGRASYCAINFRIQSVQRPLNSYSARLFFTRSFVGYLYRCFNAPKLAAINWAAMHTLQLVLAVRRRGKIHGHLLLSRALLEQTRYTEYGECLMLSIWFSNISIITAQLL